MRDFGTWHPGQGNGEGSVFADGDGRLRMGPNGTTLTAICTVHDFDGERDDHVRLIAAAPDMLESCEAARKEIMKLHQSWYNDRGLRPSMNAVALMLEQVIAKATGTT